MSSNTSNNNVTPDKTQSSSNDYMHMMIKNWENKIKAKIQELWKHHASYVYICIFGSDALGIQPMSMELKAISNVQQIRDELMNDLNKFLKLIQELENGGFGDKWNPKDHTKGENINHMIAYIKKWMGKKNGNTNNGGVLINLWKDLFGKNGKGGLVAKLTNAMNNPWYKQGAKDSLDGVKALNTNAIFDGHGTDWGTSGGHSFLAFLQGKVSYGNVANANYQAFLDSYYKNNNTGYKGDTTTYNDDVGDMTSQVEQSKQTQNTTNQADSATLSQTAQSITSLIQTIQQMVQNGSKETQQYVSNQSAAG